MKYSLMILKPFECFVCCSRWQHLCLGIFGSKTDGLLPSHVYKTNEGDTVSDIAGGDSHSLILLSCGAVYSWGNNFEVGTFSSSKVINTLITFNETRSLYIALHLFAIFHS